jgi:hypothetical protein
MIAADSLVTLVDGEQRWRGWMGGGGGKWQHQSKSCERVLGILIVPAGVIRYPSEEVGARSRAKQ